MEAESMKKQKIIIGVKSGSAFIIDNPTNIEIEVHDYDVQDLPKKNNNVKEDKDSDYYALIIL